MNDMTLPDTDSFPVARTTPQQRLLSVFDDGMAFEFGQRMAKALASSTLVPAQYQNNLPNCLILIDVARTMKMPILTVASHLNIIHGRPTWGAQFVIATINACGLFSPLRFEWRGAEGQDDWGCRATATELATGLLLTGSWISIKMAKDEGWYNRSGSKWKTMGEQMLMYRAGSFFGKIYAGHILSGMTTTSEEMYDTIDAPRVVTDAVVVPPSGAAVEATADATPLAAINEEVRERKRRRRRGAAAAALDAETGEPAPPASGPPEAPAAAAGIVVDDPVVVEVATTPEAARNTVVMDEDSIF